MAPVPLDGPEFTRWRAQARHTLDAATRASDGPAFDWACFLAEQAAQLAVKALLHGLGRPARGHDLVTLGAEVQSVVPEQWPDRMADPCRRLSRLYIPTRYPDAVPDGIPAEHFGAADAEQALDDARVVLTEVDAAWQALTG